MANSLLDTVRISVLHLEPVQGLPVLPGESIRLMFPFVKLAERYRIAVQRRQTPPVLEDRLRQNVGIEAAGCHKVRAVGTGKLFE